MFIVFRADANATIGTGHAMRCLALAQALAAQGARCLFLCRENGLGGLAERIRRDGHDLLLIPEGKAAAADDLAHAAWLPHGQAHDAALCRQLLADQPRPDWLVVDHYALDHRWETAMGELAGQLLVIDDLADRRHDCDLLLDQNLRPAGESGVDSNPYRHLVPAECAVFLGPGHALLRPEFAATRARATARPSEGTPRLLLMFGGADRADLTGRCLDLLAGLGLPLAVDMVVGPLYPYLARLQDRLRALPDTTLHVAPEQVADLMAEADLAVASPGTTSWERCALGLPAIALAVADNQVPIAEELARRGAHLFLGRADAVSDGELAAALRLLAGNAFWRQNMGQLATALCDGRGAERLARRLLAGDVSLRRATVDDARLLHRWRDDPRVRRHAFDPAPIPFSSHLAWLEKALADPEKILLIGQQKGVDFGCIRFDLRREAGEAQARISIYLDPDRLGQGLSVPLLRAADAWLHAERPEIACQVAEVMADNTASRHAFLGAGYRLDHSVFVKRGQP